MEGLASLPMYDLPELAEATADFWAGLARAFRREGLSGVPDRLTPAPTLPGHWLDPALLFSQTCGYPLTHALAGRVQLVATPRYRAEGCAGTDYCSFVLVRAADRAAHIAALAGRRCAVNALDSQSGCNALALLVAPFARDGRFFGRVLLTGSHAASIERLVAGEADVAAVDCVTYALLARWRPAALMGTRLLCRTAAGTAVPSITAATADADRLRRLRAGLDRALADPALAAAREALLLEGAEALPLAAYERIPGMAREAAALGYGELAERGAFCERPREA